VFNSPCFMVKIWLVHDQTVLGNDKSNPLIVYSKLQESKECVSCVRESSKSIIALELPWCPIPLITTLNFISQLTSLGLPAYVGRFVRWGEGLRVRFLDWGEHRVHSTFHVLNLKKCLSDEPLAIPLDEIHVDDKLNFIEEPVEIMDREVKRLKQSCILIVKFWATIKVKTVNGEVQLQALVDGKKVIITESTVRRDLQLEDAEGVDCLPNATIFEQLTLIGVGLSRRVESSDEEGLGEEDASK
ncbi:hypothetical protein Tco_0687867, partial [Tanacetum coccineum]